MPARNRLTLVLALLLNLVALGIWDLGAPGPRYDALLALGWLAGSAACLHYERWLSAQNAPAPALRFAAIALGVAVLAMLIWSIARAS